MNSILSPYVLIMIAAALICGFIVVNVWSRHQENSETKAIIILLLGIIEWILAALLGLLDQDLAHKMLWAKIEYLGVVFVPLAVLSYVLHHTGDKRQLTIRRLILTSVIPVVTLVLVWSNGAHGLIWAKYIPYRAGGLVLSAKNYGPGFWVYLGYSYLLLLAATILTIRPMLREARLFRWQSLIVLVGILAPWFGNLLYVLHLNPFGDLDLTPLAFGLTGIFLAVGMFGWRLFDIKPVAQAAVLAGMPDGLIILDTQNRIVDVNPAAQQILGRPMPELVGKPLEGILTIWHPKGESPPVIEGQNFDVRFKKGSQERIYELSDSPFFEKLGALGGRIIFLHDATPRKQLEEKLKESERNRTEALLQQSENKYETLYQNMPVGVIYRSLNGQVVDMNPAAGIILGVGLPQIRNLADFRALLKPIRPDGTEMLEVEFPGMLSLQTGQPVRDQVMGIRCQDDPEYHWINISSVLEYKPGEKKPYQAFITFQDITQARRAELALQKSEKRFRALVEHSMEEISLSDPHGNLIWESPTSRRPLGYPPGFFVGRSLEQLFHPDELKLANCLFEETCAASGNVREGQFRLRHQDGSWRWMDAVLTNLLDEPAVQAVVINYRDVTERKYAEEQLLFRNAILTATQEGSGDGLLVVDENARIVSYNQCFIEMWKIPLELVENKIDEPVLQFVSGQVADPDRFAERVHFLYDNPMLAAQEEILLKDGRIFDRYSRPMIGQDQVNYGRVWYFRDITGRKQAEQEIQRHLTDLQVLNESLLALGNRNSPLEIGSKVIEILNARLDCQHAAIHLRVENTNRLEIIGFSAPSITSEIPTLANERLKTVVGKVGHGMAGWVVENGQLLRCSDLPSDPRYIETYPGLFSGLYAPMQVHEHTIGVISIESELPGAFNENDERLLASLAKITANAIHRSNLHYQTENQLQRLATLRTIDQVISSSFDLHITLNIFLKNALAQLGVQAGMILLVNPGLTALEFAAQAGLNSKSVREIRLRLGEGELGRGVMEHRTLWLQNIHQADKPFLHPQLAGCGELRSCHVVPLIAKGQVKGALEVFHHDDFQPEPEWLDFLEMLAGQAAIAVDNNQLFEGLQRSNFELAIAYDETIQGWSHAMDLRDQVFEGHTDRVTEMTLRLAGPLGCSSEELIHIRRGALLHDIGKLGMPDNILCKPGPLNEVEWAVMRNHPQIAYDMLYPITYLRPALHIPYCHHEHWDGSGYPRGLKGEQIPLAARIFTVADVWDSLTSDRPYHKAWSEKEACQFILDGSGKQFDPQVVSKLLQGLQ